MAIKRQGKYYLTTLFDNSIHVRDINALRDSTEIGEIISFTKEVDFSNVSASKNGRKKPVTITGKVKAKFPHVFLFEDGRTFSWKDYFLGLTK